MKKEDYIKVVNNKLNGKARQIMLEQIDNYYDSKKYKTDKSKYNIGDDVVLEKGTLLHGTFKNIDGLKEILKDGLISSWFIDGRLSKYPSSVGVWNLNQNYLLKDYINFYSGGTVMYAGVFENGVDTHTNKSKVIPYTEMPKIIDITSSVDCHKWYMEQTKEARFMPSLVQNRIQIGIIFNGNNDYVKKLVKKDILNSDVINDIDVKAFVNPNYYENYYEKFLDDRKKKDDFFTNRESAILFGIPSNFIEGILVGITYEKDNNILKEIKSLLPNCYICNLDGKVIY